MSESLANAPEGRSITESSEARLDEQGKRYQAAKSLLAPVLAITGSTEHPFDAIGFVEKLSGISGSDVQHALFRMHTSGLVEWGDGRFRLTNDPNDNWARALAEAPVIHFGDHEMPREELVELAQATATAQSLMEQRAAQYRQDFYTTGRD